MKVKGIWHVVTEEDLQKIKSHQYSTQGKGIIEEYIDHFVQEYLLPFVPINLAPNVITLIGLLIQVAGTVFLFDSSLNCYNSGINPVVSLLYALCLFTYILVESCHKAQVRRTNSGSPLGELMDHGCDAITMVLILNALALLFMFNYFLLRMLVIFLLFNAFFYMTHFQAFFTGTLTFRKLGTTEGIITVLLLFIVGAVTPLSTTIYWVELPLLPSFVSSIDGRALDIAGLLFLIAVFIELARLVPILTWFYTTFFAAIQAKKNSLLNPMLPLLFAITLSMLAYVIIDVLTWNAMFQFTFVNLGFPYIKLTWKIIICNMSQCEMPQFDSCYIYQLAFVVHSVFKTYQFFYIFSTSILIWSLLDFLIFATLNINSIAKGLNVRIFTQSKGSPLPISAV